MDKKEILKFMQDNFNWILGIFTGFSMMFINILKFIEYITAISYFYYYGLDMNLYRYNDKGFLYSLCLSSLSILVLVSVFFCIYQIINNMEKKKYITKGNISNFIIIIFLNLYLSLTIGIKTELVFVIIDSILLMVFEIIVFNITIKKENEKPLIEDILDYIKKIPILIIIFICLIFFKTQISLNIINRYRIVDNNKVIVYSNNDYYLTLDCQIKDEQLLIYRGTQEKIENFNIYSEEKKFEKIIIMINN